MEAELSFCPPMLSTVPPFSFKSTLKQVLGSVFGYEVMYNEIPDINLSAHVNLNFRDFASKRCKPTTKKSLFARNDVYSFAAQDRTHRTHF